MTRNNPNLHLVNVNAYAKFGLIPSVRSQELEKKRNSTIIKDYTSVVSLRKLTYHNPNLDLVKANAYSKFDNSISNNTSYAWGIIVPRVFEEKLGDIVFGFPWCVVRGSWCVVPSL